LYVVLKGIFTFLEISRADNACDSKSKSERIPIAFCKEANVCFFISHILRIISNYLTIFKIFPNVKKNFSEKFLSISGSVIDWAGGAKLEENCSKYSVSMDRDRIR
jgi:hypothetical protein